MPAESDVYEMARHAVIRHFSRLADADVSVQVVKNDGGTGIPGHQAVIKENPRHSDAGSSSASVAHLQCRDVSMYF